MEAELCRRRPSSAFYRGASDIIAASDAWETIASRWIAELKESEYRSEFLAIEAEQLILEHKLAKVRSYPDNWDTYGAPGPALNTAAATERLLRRAFSVKVIPDSIVASAEGGIATYFFKGDKSAYVEYRNSGEAVAVMYGRTDDPIVREIDDGEASTEEVVRTISEYFD
jgi:hypothetical protein